MLHITIQTNKEEEQETEREREQVATLFKSSIVL